MLILVINRNTNLTIIQDSQITTSQIAAFFNIFHHVFTFASSHAAVSILNHHIKQNTNAITHSNDNTRFIVFLIIVNAFGSVAPSSFVQTPTTHISRQSHAQNWFCVVLSANHI